MANSKDFVRFVLDQLSQAGAGGVTARAMFGGHGLYHERLMFALITGDRLYFKVDEGNKPAFEAAGMGPFQYEKSGRRMTMAYYEAPPDALEDTDALTALAHGAMAAAARARKPPASRGSRAQR